MSAIQDLMGHSNIQTTRRYIHPQEMKKEAVETLLKDVSLRKAISPEGQVVPVEAFLVGF